MKAPQPLSARTSTDLWRKLSRDLEEIAMITDAMPRQRSLRLSVASARRTAAELRMRGHQMSLLQELPDPWWTTEA